MISTLDFSKKQIIMVFCNKGEKLSFTNDNLMIKDSEGKTKFQISCYRLFIVFIVGNTTITSVLIERAVKFGFYLALMSQGFRLNSIIGAAKEGNTLLHRKQYAYHGIDLAKYIVSGKINNQIAALKRIRNKTVKDKEVISSLKEYAQDLDNKTAINEIMGIEGLASKRYFKCIFKDLDWKGRRPRLKLDYINSVLDIGYTLLFTFIDAILDCIGFDTYCGVLHTQFYMRKSLVCDLMEPFRPLIDCQIKKSINLGQIQESDFKLYNNQIQLEWKKSADYVHCLMAPLIENKDAIFLFIRDYYRAFMRDYNIPQYPRFDFE